MLRRVLESRCHGKQLDRTAPIVLVSRERRHSTISFDACRLRIRASLADSGRRRTEDVSAGYFRGRTLSLPCLSVGRSGTWVDELTKADD
jgi:hypothetical protein